LTSSQFDSAAQAKYQHHDDYGSGKTDSKDKMPDKILTEDEEEDVKDKEKQTKRKSKNDDGGGPRSSAEKAKDQTGKKKRSSKRATGTEYSIQDKR